MYKSNEEKMQIIKDSGQFKTEGDYVYACFDTRKINHYCVQGNFYKQFVNFSNRINGLFVYSSTNYSLKKKKVKIHINDISYLHSSDLFVDDEIICSQLEIIKE
jgi:hypothetical protein